MQIIRDIEGVSLNNTIVTTGNFDGVHLGHRFLLNQLVDLAQAQSKKSVVVMFDPHPREVLGIGQLTYLSSPQDKLDTLAASGVDIVVLISFTVEMSKWSTEDFIKRILLDRLGMKTFFVGFNHRLGNPTKPSDLNLLSHKYHFTLIRCTPFVSETGDVSSSIIRQNIQQGMIQEANTLLGRPFSIPCKVVDGKKVGRTIDFPTANLQPSITKMIIPREGVYAAQILFDGRLYNGMLQVGHRPTLDDDRGLTIEIHLFDFNQDIYDKQVVLIFIDYIRDNIKFDNVLSLKEQLVNDEHAIRNFFTQMQSASYDIDN